MFMRNILIQVSLCPGVFSQFLSLIMDGVTCAELQYLVFWANLISLLISHATISFPIV